MKNYVENSKLLKVLITFASLTATLLVFTPIFFDLDSTFVIVVTLLIVTAISIAIGHKLDSAINNYIDSCVEQKRKRHVQDFFNFIEKDKEYREIIKRNTPIKSEGKEIGSQTIASAISDMKWAYFKDIDDNQ